MSQFAREYPDDPEEGIDARLEGADLERKRQEREIQETFCEWHKDPVRIAKLYRFLQLLDEEPRDVALFIESAASYADRYRTMQGLVTK